MTDRPGAERARLCKDRTTLRAGVVGLGFVGAGDQVSGDAIGQQVVNLDGTHAQALKTHRQVRLVAGSSRDPGRRQRFEERLGVHITYADWRKMLEVEELDIVSIATNSPCHAEMAVACAEIGVRAVLCEKPIATRLSDADRAIKACRDRGTLLVVNHNRRWHPLWRSVRDEIRGGTIGAVRHAVVHWSTGRLGNVGTHWFDVLRMLLGAEAWAVSGTLDPVVQPDCRGPEYHDPGGWGIVDFSNGAKAFVHAPQEAGLPLVLRLVGSLGQVTCRRDAAEFEFRDGPTRLVSAPADQPNSMELAVVDIVNCLNGGGAPASTGEEGLAALEMIVGFHVSDRRRGQWVSLPISGADRELEVRIG